MSRLFQLFYFLHFTPWERSDPPPELIALVEGEDASPAGKALDLGCGAGAQSVYLATKGWDVTGVDIVAAPSKQPASAPARPTWMSALSKVTSPESAHSG
jgi:2-polyprenyl-3-methyl-5-hydroxy-6-metoxy-1,4-benzoquinol methylase